MTQDEENENDNDNENRHPDGKPLTFDFRPLTIKI